MSKVYRAGIQLEYKGEDISKDISPFLLDFSYSDTDSLTEDISLKLHNRERLWFKDWFPRRGDEVKPVIVITDEYGKVEKVPCGEFEVDEVSANGPPNIVTIKGVSSLVSGEFKDTKRNQSWEKMKFKSIVNEIVGRNGFSVVFNILDDKEYVSLKQSNKSDIEFLLQICDELNFGLKVEDKKVIITQEEFFEKKEPDFEIFFESLEDEKKGEPRNKKFKLLSYDLSQSALTSYTACENMYKDPKTGKVYQSRVENQKEKGISGKVLKLNKKVSSEKEGEELCKKALQKENKETNPAKFTIAPIFPVAAKMLVKITGFGYFDGKYLINSVSHKISKGGYEVDLDCSKFIVGAGQLKSSNNQKDIETNSDGLNSGGDSTDNASAQKLIDSAKSMLGFSYSQKNRMGPDSTDCSGLYSRALVAAGFAKPGQAWSTRTFPTSNVVYEVPISDLKPGDLLNKYNDHAMMYIGNGQVIEAQPKRGVVIGKLRTNGYKAYRPKGL